MTDRAKGSNDSLQQKQQAAQNKARIGGAETLGIDKKLNGPNRPST